MRLVTAPTERWLDEETRFCHSRLIIASPYVGDPLPALVRRIPPPARSTVLTQTELRVFAAGSSDLVALCETAASGAVVLSVPRLHAKVYVVDRRAALVSSANATASGLRLNLECGVAVYDEATVEELARLVLRGFGSATLPTRWTHRQLRSLAEPVKVLAEVFQAKGLLPPRLLDSPSQRPFGRRDVRALTAGAGGWTALTLEGVARMGHSVFSTDDLLRVCLPKARECYPRNRFVREKLRQQLQLLRNQGLVEFLGRGRYRFGLGMEPGATK